MESIKEILMERGNMTEKEAEDLIEIARENLHEQLAEGEMPFNICSEFFGPEEDYIEELL